MTAVCLIGVAPMKVGISYFDKVEYKDEDRNGMAMTKIDGGADIFDIAESGDSKTGLHFGF